MNPRPLLAALVFAGTAGSAVAQTPDPAAKPKAVTYRLVLDRPAAEQLRDAAAGADLNRARDTLTAAIDDPAGKVAVGLAAMNLDSFRRRLAQPGAIGPGGVEVVMTAHPGPADAAPLIPGRVDEQPPGPFRRLARVAARRAGEVVLNPWSWEIRPRD